MTNDHQQAAENADRCIRCEQCGNLYDVFKAEVGERQLPNTMTGLPDHNNPWIKCPHCGFIQ